MTKGASEEPAGGDAEPSPGERDVRPVVARPRAGLSSLAIGAGIAVAAILLFLILDARRRALTAPAALPQAAVADTSASPPPLYVPPEPEPSRQPQLIRRPPPEPAPRPAPPPSPPPRQQRLPAPMPARQAAPPAPPRDLSGAALVIDQRRGSSDAQASDDARPPSGAAEGSGDGLVDTQRARAGRLADQATTVPQGTIIPAVLETALNSNHAGFARALVQHDITGFDGSRVLIPRGSRLIGQYSGQVSHGQKRALIIWTRLVRPDSTTIALNSPAADPVGRAGIEADVDSHFFSRFGGAILSSVLDLGVNVASRAADSPVILALPGSLRGTGQAVIQPTEVAPTLKVDPGTSISVFVARDLDFGSAERASADR